MASAQTARRIALLSIVIGVILSAVKITAGYLAGSTATLADGLESAGDVAASAVVLFGLAMAARPPDRNHPYGHGRLEMLSGFTVGLMLALGGVAISLRAMSRVYEAHQPPAGYAVAALVLSVAVKIVLAGCKFHFARLTRSAALQADAWNDSIDILSGCVALSALGLTLYDPSRFLAADHLGGVVIGLIVVVLGLRVVRETTYQLIDTMPEPALMEEIRAIAQSVAGARGVEKCYARKTGLQYHVDLHLEVDPDLTVRQSHEIAGEVRRRIRERLDWVADVLVHVEPYG